MQIDQSYRQLLLVMRRYKKINQRSGRRLIDVKYPIWCPAGGCEAIIVPVCTNVCVSRDDSRLRRFRTAIKFIWSLNKTTQVTGQAWDVVEIKNIVTSGKKMPVTY